jgi:hypothetical protein
MVIFRASSERSWIARFGTDGLILREPVTHLYHSRRVRFCTMFFMEREE